MAGGFRLQVVQGGRGGGRPRGSIQDFSQGQGEREKTQGKKKVLLAGHARAISFPRIGPQLGLLARDAWIALEREWSDCNEREKASVDEEIRDV